MASVPATAAAPAVAGAAISPATRTSTSRTTRHRRVPRDGTGHRTARATAGPGSPRALRDIDSWWAGEDPARGAVNELMVPLSVRAVERRVEREDPAVGGHQPVAAGGVVSGDPDHRPVEGDPTGRAVEPGVAEGEDAAVGGHQPVALAVGVEAIPFTGSLRAIPPVEP